MPRYALLWLIATVLEWILYFSWCTPEKYEESEGDDERKKAPTSVSWCLVGEIY